jgi:hypothetical protein
MVGLLSDRNMCEPRAACGLQGMAREPRQYCFVGGIASFPMHNGSILSARVCLRDEALLPPCPCLRGVGSGGMPVFVSPEEWEGSGCPSTFMAFMKRIWTAYVDCESLCLKRIDFAFWVLSLDSVYERAMK